MAQLGGVIVAWGWLLFLFLALWVAWETYLFIKHVDYTNAIKWTFLEITVPEDTPQTPKAMENAFDVWGGIHKDPDLIEKYFEGYFLAWYSCEIQCKRDQVRYILVVPTVHAKFFEGVVYGQYSAAHVTEVEDYTQEYSFRDLEKKYDLYGTEIVLVKDDYYPIRTYREYEDTFAEDDKYVDPHQALIEAYTNIGEGEQFWVQVLVKPVAGDDIQKWADKGQDKIAEISGQKKEVPEGIWAQLSGLLTKLPGEILGAFVNGPTTPEDKKKEALELRFHNPAQDAEMKGILLKVSHSAYKTKLRLIYIAPVGKLDKPSISKAIGVFKQFNTFHLNSLKPDPATKTNGPNYVLKQSRRHFRKKSVLLNYQWRDFWGDESGQMLVAEELATLYHLPVKYLKSPVVRHSPSGLGSPPDNLPYV